MLPAPRLPMRKNLRRRMCMALGVYRPRYDIRKRSLLVSGLMAMKPFCAPLSNPLPRPRLNHLNREERGGGLTRQVARASLNRPLAMWGLAPRRQFPKSEGRVG